MTSRSEYRLRPERQELDLKGFRDPLVLSWIYGGAAWSVFLGYVGYYELNSWLVTTFFFIFLVLTILMILLQITGILIAFIGKRLAFKRINRTDMSVRIDQGTFTFSRKEDPVIVIPLEQLDRIEVLLDRHELMLGPGTGYNFVTEEYDRRSNENGKSTNVTVVEENGDEKYQFWLDSRAIGNREQIDDFHSWLSSHGLDELFERSYQEKRYDWSRSDWVWLAFHTLLMVSTLAYALLKN